MLGFCVLVPFSDALAKYVGDSVPLGQMVFVRFATQAAILAPLAFATGAGMRIGRRAFLLNALRTAFHVLAMALFFLSLRALPLADAVAITFVMPFLLLFLGKLFLGETVGVRRLTACAAGFVGTLMVVRPSFIEVGAAALLPLAVAGLFAGFVLTTRAVARHADPMALQAINGAMGAAFLAPVMLVAGVVGPPDLGFAAAPASVWGLLVALGVFGTVAHLLMTWSLRFAPAATLAPMHYLEIPFATLIGWLVFGDLPDGMAAAGIAVTMAAGLYVIHRERIAAAG
ncbi:DMT family transporter [Amaricoccus sp.]|uniref:DMT family transporter n=1 Tax=Amaricoccus sp. TaxID=1872485 RepID=UPI0025B9A695|nr:DMT family transporter [Amaricoccus sp.]